MKPSRKDFILHKKLNTTGTLKKQLEPRRYSPSVVAVKKKEKKLFASASAMAPSAIASTSASGNVAEKKKTKVVAFEDKFLPIVGKMLKKSASASGNVVEKKKKEVAFEDRFLPIVGKMLKKKNNDIELLSNSVLLDLMTLDFTNIKAGQILTAMGEFASKSFRRARPEKQFELFYDKIYEVQIQSLAEYFLRHPEERHYPSGVYAEKICELMAHSPHTSFELMMSVCQRVSNKIEKIMAKLKLNKFSYDNKNKEEQLETSKDVITHIVANRHFLSINDINFLSSVSVLACCTNQKIWHLKSFVTFSFENKGGLIPGERYKVDFSKCTARQNRILLQPIFYTLQEKLAPSFSSAWGFYLAALKKVICPTT